jgi:hypothetical protein
VAAKGESAEKRTHIFGKPPSPAETEAVTDKIKQLADRSAEYCSQVGLVAQSWNGLQESLGRLFASILSSVPPKVSLAIWYSEPNDRAQRRLLRAAVNAGALDHTKHAQKLPPSAKDDLLWLLNEADKLGARRDQALHAPVTFDPNAEKMAIIAAYFQGNPLAEQLRDKDLVREFELSTRRVHLLTFFAMKFYGALEEQQIPWPDKPPSLSHAIPRLPRDFSAT